MGLEAVAQRVGVTVPTIQLVAEFEGCLKKVGPDQYGPYPCPAKVPTIGIGTTVYNETGRKVTLSDLPITRAKAEDLLGFDLGVKYAPAVRRAVKKFQTVNQYGACVSMAYNVGTAGFSRSTLCWLINQGQHAKATDEFLKWTRGGGRVLPGLVRRRKAERAMFLTPGPAYSAKPEAPTPTAGIPVGDAFPPPPPNPPGVLAWLSQRIFRR